MASGGFTVSLSEKCPYRPEYVLGLLNSRLLFWELEQISNLFRGGWITCTKQYLGELPIRSLDVSAPGQKEQHDMLVRGVQALVRAKMDAESAGTNVEKTYFKDKCAGLDRQINQLVYELYDLTEEEIALVEGTGN